MNRRNFILFALLAIFVGGAVSAQEIKPTKNVIVMIPDGTSVSVYSASRWMKKFRKEGTALNIDPYICATVNTFSSDAPIGDSAPTTSCYMTGYTGQAGNISIYPVSQGENDLYSVDPDSAYQPLTTLAEAMKLEQQKSIGIVATCQFPHATPADCTAHYYDRGNYAVLAQQMAFNHLDVVVAGGTKYVTERMKKQLKSTGTTYLENDKNGFLNFQGDKIWSIYGKKIMQYDLDRDPEKEPSLAEITEKTINILNKNKNGFFLMVEGSKVDWAAHANDPVGIISEFLAFDAAIGKAIEFAKKDGNTTIVVLTDHGNSGFSIGRAGLKKSYAKMSLEELFGDINRVKKTSYGLEQILKKTEPTEIKEVFKKYTNIDLTKEELKTIIEANNYEKVTYDKVANSYAMSNAIVNVFKDRFPFGFTTGGHTGEEVLLSIYNPNDQHLRGNVYNRDVHKYLYAVSGLQKPMKNFTEEIYAKHANVFKGLNYEIKSSKLKYPTLVVTKGDKKLEVPAFSSVVYLNGKPIDLKSVVVYIDKNNTFYLPKNLIELL